MAAGRWDWTVQAVPQPADLTYFVISVNVTESAQSPDRLAAAHQGRARPGFEFAVTTDPAYARAVGIQPRLKADQISAMLLLSGAYDPSAVDFEGDFGWFLKTTLWAYSGVKNFRENERFRLTSVTRYVTKAFPPAFISSGNGDPLAPQAIALAQKLAQLGVRVETLFFPTGRAPALPHEYQFNLDDPAGREALNRMLTFLRPMREQTAAGQSPR